MKTTGLLGRLVIGTLLGVAASLVAVFGSTWLLALVVAVWSVLATIEFVRLLKIAEIHLNPWLLASLNAALAAAAWLGWLPVFLIVPLAAIFVIAVVLGTSRPRIPVYGLFVIVYLGFLPAHLVMLKELTVRHSVSSWLVLFPLLLTWTNDTAAWGFGKLLGRHKLTPRLSPHKTREGFIAGLIFSALLAALFLKQFSPLAGRPWFYLAFIGVGLGAVAQIGDLFESIFKRAAGIKDSSTALGEHGGFLDRVDSLLFSVPAWYYLLLFYLR